MVAAERLISMTPSSATRIAQSRLANAVKRGLSDETVSALRNRFAVERAIDAIRAIPNPLEDECRSALLNAIAERSSEPPQGGSDE